jgi:site-specific DNA-methyltransferase (adenine-specific)
MNAPQIFHGNNIDLLRQMPDCSVDAIVTDPPYELGFMGKKWDSTGIAYSVELWSECLRVLKHGGHLLAFSGSRTYHRMAVAIEDAGFDIRDQIMWVYGSGFPKSLDISKAIDKTNGIWRGRAGAVSSLNGAMSGGNYERTPKGKPVTDEAQHWSGWGTALKPAHEPIVMARKPLAEKTVAENVLRHGTGAINIDGCRVESTDSFGGGAKGTSGFADGYAHDGWVAGSSLGRFPANFIHDGSEEVLALFPDTAASNKTKHTIEKQNQNNQIFGHGLGTISPENTYSDSGSAARFFYCAKANKAERNAGLQDLPEKEAGIKNESGRGFSETDPHRKIMRQNFHPTVKPIALMRYLVRMVTPPNGTVLDPFAGSGTTLVAAILEGFDAIGMELTADYLPIIEGRVAWALAQQPEAPTLF